jgi:pyridoxine 5-phosphate synthase
MIQHRPKRVTLVPENRAEVTTEGGLDLLNNFDKINLAVQKLNKNGIDVSLFIDPTNEMVELSKKLSVQWCEFHTGRYANIFAMLHTDISQTKYSVKEFELPKNELEILLKNSIDDLSSSVDLAYDLGLNIAAGHGLNYKNLKEILKIKKIQELNIGQSIIARSIYTGLQTAIKDIKKMINEA